MYFSLEKKSRAFTIHRNTTYLSAEPHLHSHLELVYMRENGKSVTYADNKSDILEKGDLFVAFPNQVHYYHDTVKPVLVDIFLISPEMCPEFKDFFENYVPETNVLKGADKNPVILNSLNTILNLNSEKDLFTETTVRGSMLVLLSEYFRLKKLEKVPFKSTDTTEEIIKFCYENYTNDISLQSIADKLHISRYYISHLFGKRLHVCFNDYINSLRIRKACELLKSDKLSVTDIAHTVGYNTVRTFNRCFRDVRGITPSEYRANAHKSKK